MPLILPDTESPEFDTADRAAHALADKSVAAGSTAKEVAGLLYKKANGKFVYSKTLQGDRDHFELRAGVPHGHSIAGIVHTHPSDDPTSQVFSSNDIDVAKQLQVPSYVRFLHDGSTRVFVPGKTATRNLQIPGNLRGMTVASGDVVPPPPSPVDPTTVAPDAPVQPPLPPFAAFAASPTPQS